MKELKYTGQQAGDEGYYHMSSGPKDACLEHLAKKGCDAYVVTPGGNYLGRDATHSQRN